MSYNNSKLTCPRVLFCRAKQRGKTHLSPRTCPPCQLCTAELGGIDLPRKSAGENSKLIVFLSIFIIFIGCAREQEVTDTRIQMGTLVEIKVIDKNTVRAKQAIEAAFQEVVRVENLMTRFKKESPLSQLNKKGYSNDKELFDIINKAIEISKLTDGGFDITVGPLMKLWNIKAEHPQVPSKSQIQKILLKVGYKKIKLNTMTKEIRVSNYVDIDLGGIAKGYGVDKAIEVLQKEKIKTALVNAGGDLRVMGAKEWEIGLQNPRGQDIISSIKLKNMAIVTSGDYEQYFIKDGKRYHHIMNPRTGFPADKCQSVTIITPSAALADGLATGVFVMGVQEGMKVIESLPEVEAIIIDSVGRTTYSSGLEKKGEIYTIKVNRQILF